MTKWTKFLINILVLVIGSGFVSASIAKAADYRINEFKSDIQIYQNTRILVTETIYVDFLLPKHGIYRDIPVIYRSKDKNVNIRLSNVTVTNEKGIPYQFESSQLGDFKRLKIGDPDKTMSGYYIYVITYQVSNVLQRFEDHDEFYWNVVGSNWDIPVERVDVRITSPYAQVTKTQCYSLCQLTNRGGSWFTSSEYPINPGQDLTVVLGFNKNNSLVFPSQTWTFWIDEGMWMVLMVIPGIGFALLWFFKGRDSKYISGNVYYKEDGVKEELVNIFEREHLPTVFSPISGLTPAEAGTILDMKVDISDVVAEIAELARLGYMKIFKVEEKRALLPDSTDYLLARTEKKASADSLHEHQLYLLDNLFNPSFKASISTAEKYMTKDEIIKLKTALVSKMKGKFYTDLNQFKEILYKNLTEAGYFSARPDTRRAGGMMIAGIVGSIATVLANTQSLSQMIWPIGAISTVMAMFFGYALDKRTAKGHAYYRQLAGLKYYVGKGKWRYDIQEKHLFLEEILPLAISLGVVDKLTADMKDLQMEAPKYMGNMPLSSFGGISRNMGGVMASTPSGSHGGWSGGSGFSGGGGGGFGGGGGGSW